MAMIGISPGNLGALFITRWDPPDHSLIIFSNVTRQNTLWLVFTGLYCIYGGIPYITVLYCHTHQNYVTLCHQKTEKKQKATPKEYVSTSTTADIHTYFLQRSDIKFTFLQKKTHTHQRTQMSQDVNLQTIDPCADGAYYSASCEYRPTITNRSGGGVVSIHRKRMRRDKLRRIMQTSPRLEEYGGGGLGWGISGTKLWEKEDILLLKERRGKRNRKWRDNIFFR